MFNKRSHSQESLREQERDLQLHRRQVSATRKDLEQMAREREEALAQLRKISNTQSYSDMERRNIAAELEKSHKESDDLRRQVHKYIDEVRRIEELLQAKVTINTS